MKKSLLVTIDYPPHYGGVARYWQTVAELLPPSHWIVLSDTKQQALFFRYFWPRWLKGVSAIYHRYRQEKCEQIVVAQLLPVGAMVWMLSLLFHFPYVVQLYGMDLALVDQSRRKRWLARQILRRARLCLVNSQATGKRLQTFGRNDYTVVYPVPKLEIHQSTLATEPIILSVGRLVERKGYDQVLRAMPALIKNHPKLNYVMIGDGPEREMLMSLAAELGVQDHVRFLGALDDEERDAWLAKCSVLAMPSRETASDVEGFGMVFLEAYAFAKPVVGGKSGGMAEAVRDGESGILVDPESVQELSKALDRLLSDPTLGQRYGLRGQQLLASDFSLARMRDTLMSVL